MKTVDFTAMPSNDQPDRWRNPAAWTLVADICAILIALSLPWSTSLVSVFVMVWLIAVVPTLVFKDFLRVLKSPAAALPVAVSVLAIIAMLWSDAVWNARVHSASQTVKLLLIPLLIYHYRRSSRGHLVFVAFVASCAVLMMTSFAMMVSPTLAALRRDADIGVPVKNYIDQSQSFSLCAVALGYPAADFIRRRRYALAGLMIALSAGFVVNLVFIVTSRTALVSLPFLLLALAFGLFGLRSLAFSIIAVLLIGALAWMSSAQIQTRLASISSEYARYKANNDPTSVGLRLEFWRKSIGFIETAPILGHGTGSIEGLFVRAAGTKSGTASAETIRNPHNQTLASAVQWGVLGVMLLYAMWSVHLLLMSQEASMMASIGLLVVLQNMATSIFNSHLFDFVPGWMYVLGVGIAAGMADKSRLGFFLREADRRPHRFAAGDRVSNRLTHGLI